MAMLVDGKRAMPVTRRQIAAAGIASLFLPSIARGDTAALEAGARKEGSLTWYVAQVDSETAEIMGRAFTAQYPGVKVDVIRTTGQVAYERLLQDLKNGAPQCDVLSTTDISHMPALLQRKALANFTPDNAAFLAPAFQGMGQDGWWYPNHSTLMLIVRNTAKVPDSDAPTNWNDLLAPKWKGQVAFGHPAFSGYVGVWTVEMRKLYGWDYFDKLSHNNPRIGRSGNDPITLVNAGECVVGLGPLSTTLLSASKGNPIAPIYPSDGSLLCIGPSGVLASAPHPNAGRLFMNWLLSKECAQVMANNFQTPVRDDVPAPAGMKPLADVKLLRVSTEEIGKGVPEVIEQWRDTFS
jgi:iron(III) transport system substrate-binding protein